MKQTSFIIGIIVYIIIASLSGNFFYEYAKSKRKEQLIETDVKTLIKVLEEYPEGTRIIISDIKLPEYNLGENIKNFEERKITEL